MTAQLMVREVTDDNTLADAIWLRGNGHLDEHRGVDTVRSETLLVLYDSGPVASAEVRWNSHGLVGLNRMVISGGVDRTIAEQTMVGHALKRRPPWVPTVSPIPMAVAS